MSQKQSIYRSPDFEAKLMTMYDARLEQWPSPYKSTFLNTYYGKVHVIISGPKDAPPVLLLHAAGMSASSWLYNIEGLNRHYRTYAIDNIGEVGKSVLNDLNSFPNDGKALSELYTEISDKLGVDTAYAIGASNGGFIATNHALYAPERVKKLVLLGPMGVTPATDSTIQKIEQSASPDTQVSPKHMLRWALGDNPRVLEAFGEWFGLVMSGTTPRVAAPIPFTPEQLQSIRIPVLLVLGEKDNLVGDPEKVKEFVKNVPDIQIEVLNTGHLISADQPDNVNNLIYEFLEQH
ncbi:MAG: alpha/beta fold hydrolase [Promethearchaeota archaeon]